MQSIKPGIEVDTSIFRNTIKTSEKSHALGETRAKTKPAWAEWPTDSPAAVIGTRVRVLPRLPHTEALNSSTLARQGFDARVLACRASLSGGGPKHIQAMLSSPQVWWRTQSESQAYSD